MDVLLRRDLRINSPVVELKLKIASGMWPS